MAGEPLITLIGHRSQSGQETELPSSASDQVPDRNRQPEV